MKDKKKFAAAVTGIISTLKKGYQLLNEQEQLPEVDDASLPNLAGAIIRQLQREICIIEENAQYEGMSPEEVESKKEQERADNLVKLQEESAAELAKMRDAQKPVEQDPEPATDEETDQEPASDAV